MDALQKFANIIATLLSVFQFQNRAYIHVQTHDEFKSIDRHLHDVISLRQIQKINRLKYGLLAELTIVALSSRFRLR